LALSVRAVKQTDRHHRRRCREIHRRRRFCSPLRRWYLRWLLVGIFPYPLELLGVADPLDIP